MPVRNNREYRMMPLMEIRDDNKKIDSEFYVEGYATTFNDPYVMFTIGDTEYKEQVDKHALDGADLSDVLYQHNHTGEVMARTKMRQGVPSTLLISADDRGLLVAADLSKSERGRAEHEAITNGLVYQMSWAFTVAEETYDYETHTRTIQKIEKVYDVSSVDLPANPSTTIDSRSWCGGVAEAEQLDLVERERKVKIINLLTMEV